MQPFNPFDYKPTPEQARLMIRIANELNHKDLRCPCCDGPIEFMFETDNLILFNFGIIFGAEDGVSVHVAFYICASHFQIIESAKWFSNFPNCHIGEMPAYLRNLEDVDGVQIYVGDEAFHHFSHDHLMEEVCLAEKPKRKRNRRVKQ